MILGVVAVTTKVSGQATSDSALVVAGGVPHQGSVPTASPRVQPTEGRIKDQQPGAIKADPSPYAAWAADVSGRTGVSARALEAYAAVESRLATDQPACHLTWTTLAAIGSVESVNGSMGGGLTASGRPLTPIVGVALNGVGAVAAVGDTDDGELDGDSSVDRAVGPLQFLPSTWASWGADGDGDGVRDPQDIDDAALAAGRYLCAAGDLAGADGWTAAVLSYNHSQNYLNAVLAAANAIAAGSVG